jgi:predicted metalloendopeptidase
VIRRPLLTFAALALIGLAPVLTRAQAPQSGGVDLAGMDRSVKPGDDFFAFANGTWVRNTEIPPDRASWGANNELADLTDKRVADLIQGASSAQGGSGRANGAEARKVAEYHAAYMDEAGIEAKGLGPLKVELSRIDAIKSREALSAYLGSTVRVDVDMLNNSNFNSTPNLFGLWIAADLDQPTRYAPFVVQGGLSLPNRDYYLQDNARMKDIRARFQAHAAKVLTLAGVLDADRKAASILALETAIARTHAPTVDIEDPAKGNNHWRRADFEARAPGLDWSAFLAAAGLPAQQQAFVVWTPSAVVGEAALVRSQPLEVWKAWLTFHLVDRWSNLLPKAFVDERFAFYGRTLSGTPQLLPRWKRAVSSANGALGEVIGKLYVARYFPPADKAAVQRMVDNIKVAFHHRIDALDWMAPATKREAHAKVDALIVGVGYPDKWRDYSGLVISPKDALGNARRAELFDTRLKLSWLAKPVDRREWVMTPQTVNAVNLPVLNSLNFPAAELQPPHFDPKALAAANYGSIGAIIGHEISHSFDNNGALFDSTGRMRNWWTKADFAHFAESGKALAKQFDAYCPFPDLCVNGEQTLSENIADLAGLSASYDAWKSSLGGKPAPVVQGLDGDQQFFLSFAQTWRSKSREPALRQQILTNGHAPSAFRAQTVRNLDPWYAAFAVTPGQKLYLDPKARVRVW